MFKREKIKYEVIEVPQGTKLPELTGELRESLKALPSVPSFNYILMRLRYDKSTLERYLRDGMDLTDQQLRYLQAGIYWLGHVEREIKRLSQTSEKPRPATNEEASEFERIRQAVTLVE